MGFSVEGVSLIFVFTMCLVGVVVIGIFFDVALDAALGVFRCLHRLRRWRERRAAAHQIDRQVHLLLAEVEQYCREAASKQEH